MATVVLVEDEDTLRDSVARYLEFEGHEVLSAANGREAFDVGVSGRPDVLVADWMLRNHIHGLHVAQTLRVVDPELATVLITGFPSRDLEQEFAAGGVTQMLEKPFDLEELHRAVVDAAQLRPASGTGAAAVLEVAADGAIRFANDRARSLLTATQAGRDTAHVADLLGPGFTKIFDAAVTDWVEVEPLDVFGPVESVRTRRRHEEDGGLVER